MQKKEKILIIIPAYNEEKSILKTYNEIIEYNNKNKTKYNVIVINDGSKDNTEKVLKENNIPHIRLIQNLGIGGAVQTGYKYALKNNYDIAVQFDGDGQHDVNYIQTIIKPIIESKADMVIGSRFIQKDFSDFKSSKMRRIGINMISRLIDLKTGKKIYDTTSGFRAINKKIIKIFASDYPVEYPEPISTVNVLLKKYTVREVPVKMKKREEGVSSISSWKSAYYMINVMLSILLLRRVK
ncbi:MAG: glycosyltransferase family 2 protein [Firmicutes bacterium]|nr:glycosyltransferase family 2 protein [Bacillota bacterium]